MRFDREEKFNCFEKRYITYTEHTYYADSDFSELVQRYDCFITGSDQVWNPYYEGTNPFFYLGFVPKGRRIAYAPSIAHNVIPEAMKGRYKKWLGQIDYLSVREIAGRDLIMKEFGLAAKVVCDPVFLLSEDEWHSISVPPQTKKKYFAVYILGKKTVELKDLIRAYEKKYQLVAIDIYSKDEARSYFAGPEEFLGLIENAEFVFTDSFHGTAFSVIFQKPMVIVARDGNNKTSSRVDSLLHILGIKNRKAEYILQNPKKMPIDYSDAIERLTVFAGDSKEYLLSALEINHCNM